MRILNPINLNTRFKDEDVAKDFQAMKKIVTTLTSQIALMRVIPYFVDVSISDINKEV